MTQLYTNNGIAKTANPISATDTVVVLPTGDGELYPTVVHPEDWFLVTLEDRYASVREIVKVTARIGDTFTIVRAQEDTTAMAWPADSVFDCRITAGTLNTYKTKKEFIIGVDPAETKTVDSVNLNASTSTTISWSVSLDSPSTNKIFVVTILATYSKFSDKVYHTEYAALGDGMAINLDIEYDTGYLKLVCTNNEPGAVNVHINRNPS